MARSRLGELLQERGGGGRWVAAQLGVHESAVSRWAQGHRPIPEAHIEQVAELLNVPPGELREPMGYVGRDAHGCVVLRVMDLPRLAQDNAREVAHVIRDGGTVERLPVNEATRAQPFGCQEART
jgi:transcriptional regulator with XRE-family HTH domain